MLKLNSHKRLVIAVLDLVLFDRIFPQKGHPELTDNLYLLDAVSAQSGLYSVAKRLFLPSLQQGDAPDKYEHMNGAGSWKSRQMLERMGLGGTGG